MNVPLGDRLSVYPRATVGFEWVRRDEQVVSGSSASVSASPLGYPSTTQTGPWVAVFLPVLFHVRPHFFVGAGPSLSHDFAHVQGGPDVGGQATQVAAWALVGGTWGGSMQASTEPAAAPPSQRRFGDVGQIVLDDEVTAQVFWTTYEGSNSSTTSATFEPSADYFLAPHVSIGIAPYVSYGKGTGVDPVTGAAVSNEVTTGGLTPRVGFDVPLSSALSWYPRAGLAFGVKSYDEISATAENKVMEVSIALQAYAPVLVHPAPHLFVGFGPSIYLDLSRNATFPDGTSVQNRNTTIGAGLVVGGWL